MRRKLTLIVTVILSAQFVLSALVPVSASTNAPIKSVVPSIVHEDVEGDLLNGIGSFDDESILENFANSIDSLKRYWIEDENGGYLEGDIFPKESSAHRFDPGVEIPAGKYKITFWVRTVYEGHKNVIYPQAFDADGKLYFLAIVGITDEWVKVEAYAEFAAPLSHINFRGGMPVESVVPYCIDELSIVPVKSIPGNYTLEQGADVSEADIKASYETLQYIDIYSDYPKWNPDEDYDVEGLMLNLDNTTHNIGAVKNEQDVVDWANQFRGTHVTDMVMNFAESKCVYPSEVYFGWYGDPWTVMKDGVITETDSADNVHGIDREAYYNHYKVLGLDYLKTLTTALPEAGINMWLSIRMNDAHDRGLEVSPLFTRYYFEHPEFRRVRYDSIAAGNKLIWDYAFPEIREKYLALLNEALDRYDVYGFQFEWMREMWIFHPGGEYAGMEILNQFHRDADAIISIYEEKYDHEIKFSVTVAPDIQTNYDFGLDIMTWASEGILDMVVPMGHYRSNCNETPVALWKSLLKPYGVEIVPCIESGITTTPNAGRKELEIEKFTGAAALYLSQGADQIQLYNVLPGLDYRVKENQKLAIYDTESLASTGLSKFWSIFTSCGSYEKLMTVPRKLIPTYNNVQQVWKSTSATAQLPMYISAGKTGVVRIGMGDIPEGATVTLKFSSDRISENKLPVVYVNSEPCKFVGVENTSDLSDSDIAFTADARYVYEVPESVHDDMWSVVEITPTARPGFTVNYAEIYIEPTK